MVGIRFIFSLAVFLLFSFSLLAQKGSIQGQVQDVDKENLVSASVVILSVADSTLVSFGLTDTNGSFDIKNIDVEKIVLQISYLGYEQYSQELNLNPDNRHVDLGIIELKQSASQIEQVTIEGEHTPIQIKRDTIEYNAAAFTTQPNEVVEDLLKRLPGVEVDNDGSITAQGEEVEQVLVDGKEFFGNDPKIATRNLPADAVDKVQIYDEKSEMAEFSGVDDGEREKTINLQLKEDRRKGFFGTITAGYGTEDRYNGRISLNRFDSKMQLSALGNINNINEQGFSVNEYISFMGGLGSLMGGGGRGSGSDIPLSSGLSNGFVTTQSGGLNLNYDFSNKTEISVNYFINSIENVIDQISIRDNFLTDGSYLTTQDSRQVNQSDNHKINIRLEHEIDSTQDIRLRSSLGFNDGMLRSDELSQIFSTEMNPENETDREYMSVGDNVDFSGRLLYRKKLGYDRRQTFTVEGRLNSAVEDFMGENYSEITDYPDDPLMTMTEFLVQDQLQNDDQTDYRIQTSYVKPIAASRFLELKYIRQNYNTEIIRDVFDIVNGDRFENINLSSHYIRNYSYDRLSSSLHFNSDKTQLTLEAALQNSRLDGDIISEGEKVNTDIFRFLPRIRLRHELGPSHNIRFNYTTSVREPSLTQLQPITDNSDPQNIYIGNPDLVPEYRHSIRLNYIKYDQFTFSSFFGFINASYTRNKITEQTIKEPGVQIRQSVNVDYDFNLNGTLSYSTPFRPLKIKTDIRTRLGYQKSLVFINGIENQLDRYTGNIRFSIENRKKEMLDWLVGGTWGYNINNYSDATSANQEYFSQTLFADFNYNYKNKLAINSGLDVNFYSEEAFGEAQTVPILKASLSAYFLKDQRGELKFSVFDLLNKNLGISRTSNLNYIENTEIISLGRYFMFSFIYSIRGMGENGQNQQARFKMGR